MRACGPAPNERDLGRAGPGWAAGKLGARSGQARGGRRWPVHLAGPPGVPPSSAPPSTSWTARPLPVAVTRARAAILALPGGHCSWVQGPGLRSTGLLRALVCGCWPGGSVLLCEAGACGGRWCTWSQPEEGCWSGARPEWSWSAGTLRTVGLLWGWGWRAESIVRGPRGLVLPSPGPGPGCGQGGGGMAGLLVHRAGSPQGNDLPFSGEVLRRLGKQQ